MGDPIFWLFEVAIEPGKLDDFKSVARDLIAATEMEPGTLVYEWNLSGDGTTCHICERYADSAAAMVHVASFGRFAERFFAACKPVRIQIYGNASAELEADFAALNPVYLAKFGGFWK